MVKKEKNVTTLHHCHFFCCSASLCFPREQMPHWAALRRGKSLTCEYPCIRTNWDCREKNKDDDYYFQAKGMEAFHKLSQSSDTLSNAGTLPPPPLSTQTHWQKTTINKSKANTESKHKKSKAQLSIQSCNCFLKLIKIARLATLILVNLGLPPLYHSTPFICFLFSHL